MYVCRHVCRYICSSRLTSGLSALFVLSSTNDLYDSIDIRPSTSVPTNHQGADVRGVFARMAEGARLIEAGVKKVTGVENAFMMHPKFGAIACCPSNLGTGMRGSVHILVPKLIEVKGFKWIDNVARKRNCQARGSSGEHSEVVDRIDLSNWRRIGFPEYQLVQDMIHVANLMSKWEDKAVAGEEVPDDIE
jgi:creatine kinase